MTAEGPDGGRPEPRVVVVCLTAAWATVALAALLLVDDRTPGVSRPMPWPVIFGLLVATQAWVINVQIHREARSVFVSEIPMFLALMCLAPWQIVALRTAAAGVGFGLVRRQYRQPQKLVFNTALAAAEGGVAVLALQLLAPEGASMPLVWLAGVGGAAAASSFSGFGVALIIELLEGHVRGRQLVRFASASAASAAPVASVGCCVWAAWEYSPWAALPLAVAAGVFLWGYRSYAALREKHLALERLYGFSQSVAQAPALDDVLAAVLRQARETLHAERAWIVFPADQAASRARVEVVLDDAGEHRTGAPDLGESDWLANTLLNRGKPVLLSRGTRQLEQRTWLDSHELRDALLVPLRDDAGPIAVLAVDNRLGDARGFEAHELQVLETVAHQAAVALRNGELLQQLQHESLHDPLTGLPNRIGFQSGLEARLQAAGPAFAVGILDLDSFKEVNDTLGHQEGDRLLCEVATRLSAVLPAGALARLGGDEFAVVLTSVADGQSAVQQGERLLRAMAGPVVLAGIEIDVSASLGLALVPVHGNEVGQLMKRADQAMYDAKHHGRELRLFEVDLDTGSPSKLALVGELRQAIAQREIQIHVQPKVASASGRVVGTEALARWSTPSRGAVPPVDFIPLAERSGLIRPLTRLVLEKSVAACARWQADLPRVGVSVNLSVRSLSDERLVEMVQRELVRHGLTPGLLTLEITESHIMADPESALAVLERLRALGVRLSVDDFGTGYSSLSYLRRFPVDELKIDRSFVHRMVAEPDDAAIVRSIVELAKTLGLRTVAEGVEDEDTWQALTALGVDEIQGFVISRPVPVTEFLGRRPSATRSVG
ncbi:MAG: putative bifunctional diguanylate cyclase/phosphodiesterase [Mycobacteriales bacterium]